MSTLRWCDFPVAYRAAMVVGFDRRLNAESRFCDFQPGNYIINKQGSKVLRLDRVSSLCWAEDMGISAAESVKTEQHLSQRIAKLRKNWISDPFENNEAPHLKYAGK